MSIEAKDIYASERQKTDGGYGIRDRDGNISVRKFINTLDYSLDSIKLREVYEKKRRRKDFAFFIGNKEYTKMIINVTFKYSYKLFNKVAKNIYVRDGYKYRDCVFENCVCVQDGKLVAIQTGVELENDSVPLSTEMLEQCFSFEDNHYIQKGTIPVLKTKAELRKYLYDNGFDCDNLHYVRYKRSSGSSRVGKCLFVYDLLAAPMKKWDKCGLKINEGDKIDLAAYEAYISLPMSSIIDTVEILPQNILIIDDYDSIFEDEVVAVESEDNKLISSIKKSQISNSIWDGQSLMDVSLFGKYSDKGMLLLRNRFFKTCAFNTNIQQFFKDNHVTDISQLHGKTLATDISEIKLITTPNSVKYLKFGTLEGWLNNIDITFGIVKYEKETHFFDGRMVQTHYQLLNTLQFTCDDMEKFLQPSLDYINYIRNDPDILRYHIKYPYEQMEITPLNSKNEIIFKMLGINNKFSKTKLYYDFRNDLVKSMIEKLKDGRVLINGNYSTLFGNGLEMLKSSIGLFNGESELQGNEVHSKRFDYGITLLGSRSPHVTMGDIALFRNKRSEAYDRYFNLSKEIICINSINNNILQRLQGCDFDSDSLLLTDNQRLIELARKNYDIFKVPTCLVKAKKTQRYYTTAHQCDLDIRTSVNKIGEIINLSQQLNSLLWDNVNRGQTIEEQMELYCDICKLSALSGIEIDKAKKEFAIDSVKEIKWLKEKYKIVDSGKTVKPMFFKRITLGNGYELSDKIKYKYFKTSMDYLQQKINKYNFRQSRKRKEAFMPFSVMIKEPSMIAYEQGYYYEQKNRILNIITNTKKSIHSVYSGYDTMSADEKEQARRFAFDIKQECVEYINNISTSKATMYLLLKDIEKDKSISKFIFEILFGAPNTSFFEMIIDSKEDLSKLCEWKHGNIQIYDFLFYKEKVS